MNKFATKAAKKTLVYLVGLAIVLELRGYYISTLIDGRYPLLSLLEDVLGLALLMAFFHGLYFVVNLLLAPLWESRRRKRIFVAGLLRVAFVALVVFPALVGFIQVHPQKIQTRRTPEIVGLEYENVEFLSEGLTLRGWFLPFSGDPNAIVLLVHGLNANKQNFLQPAKIIHDLGYPVLIFDMRSHGDSDGRTFTFGVKERADVKAGYDWLRAKFPEKKIYGVGYSAGAAALLQAAAEYSIFDKLVLDSTFSSLGRIAKQTFLHWFGPLQEPAWQLGRCWAYLWTGADLHRYDGVEELKKFRGGQIFIIHGTNDHIIPAVESELLAKAAPSGSEVWFIEGADHLQGILSPEYSKRIGAFLER